MEADTTGPGTRINHGYVQAQVRRSLRRAKQELARKLEANYYPQGKAIFASRPSPGLAIIRKGAARLLDKDHRFLDKRSEGEIFGHDIYFHGELKDYFAEAE